MMFHPSRSPKFLFAALFVIASGSVDAQQAAPPSGSWSGVLRGDKIERVRVDADFRAAGVSLHFSDPFDCRIDAGFVERSTDGIYYAFRPSTSGGAFCDKLYPGELLLLPVTDAGLPLTLNNGTMRWSGTLKATAAAP